MLPDAVLALDVERGRFVLANAAATTLAGLERQRMVGARMAVREAAHLLNNDLQLTMGSLDLLQHWTASARPPRTSRSSSG